MNYKFCLTSIFLFFCLTHTTLSQIDHTEFNPPIEIIVPDSLGSTIVSFDINNDTIYDIYFEVELFETMETSPKLISSHRSKVFSYGENKVNPGPFALGESISSSIQYLEMAVIYGWVPEFGGLIGNWAAQKIDTENSAFIGVKLLKNGDSFYGWVELKTSSKFIEILGYSIQSNSNTPILTGQY